MPFNAYLKISRERAKRAIASVDLDKADVSQKPTEFRKLFTGSKFTKIRPLQKVIDDIPQKHLEAQFIAVIEANMGEGKTEAGFLRYIADQSLPDETCLDWAAIREWQFGSALRPALAGQHH